jgi:hypothetical protein
MIRFTLLVVLRSILAVVLVFALWRLLRQTWTSFWQGLRGPRSETPNARGRANPPAINYHDVKDASFKDEQNPS